MLFERRCLAADYKIHTNSLLLCGEFMLYREIVNMKKSAERIQFITDYIEAYEAKIKVLKLRVLKKNLLMTFYLNQLVRRKMKYQTPKWQRQKKALCQSLH